MGNLHVRWAGWAAGYLVATAAAVWCVVKLAGVFDDAVLTAEARGQLVDELRGQLGPVDVDEHQDHDNDAERDADTAPGRLQEPHSGPDSSRSL